MKVLSDSSGWSFQGTWDPKEAAFAVLNQVLIYNLYEIYLSICPLAGSFQGTWDPKEAAFSVLNQVANLSIQVIYPIGPFGHLSDYLTFDILRLGLTQIV